MTSRVSIRWERKWPLLVCAQVVQGNRCFFCVNSTVPAPSHLYLLMWLALVVRESVDSIWLGGLRAMRWIAPMALLAIALVNIGPVHATMLYDVMPYDLGDGYQIEGGTITTDDAMSEIIAWDIHVSGAVPFRFVSTNPDAETSGPAFNITPEAITVEVGGPTSTHFLDFDNSHPDCDSCRQMLTYSRSGTSVSYKFKDFSDRDPKVNVNMSQTPTVVVATIVPEPAAAALLSLAGVALSVAWHRRRLAAGA